MSTHVMIDLETLGTSNEAVILSLGAAKFDPTKTVVDETFYLRIDPESCTQYGLKIDAPTVMWWLHPERMLARNALHDSEMPIVDLASALEGFALWYGKKSLPTWGNGATFDNVIMRSAYQKTGLGCPWKFWHDRCYRTFKALAPDTMMRQVGMLHHALGDAISQAQHLQAIVSLLGLKL